MTIKSTNHFEPVRTITTGAMQSRFSVEEEVAILEGVNGVIDYTAQVMRSRLFNAKYADLDYEEVIYGVSYLVNYFAGINKLFGGVTPGVRSGQLLQDGAEDEKYKGVF